MVGGEISPFVNKLKEPYESNHYKSQSKKLDFLFFFPFFYAAADNDDIN